MNKILNRKSLIIIIKNKKFKYKSELCLRYKYLENLKFLLENIFFFFFKYLLLSPVEKKKRFVIFLFKSFRAKREILK